MISTEVCLLGALGVFLFHLVVGFSSTSSSSTSSSSSPLISCWPVMSSTRTSSTLSSYFRVSSLYFSVSTASAEFFELGFALSLRFYDFHYPML
jgi:hypothetical protein